MSRSHELRVAAPSTVKVPKHLKSGYRPEIEGLRALAALLVVVYHVWLGRVSGGVDVFFVVTGFFITLTVLRGFERSGSFRPGAFFLSLVRRLWPAATLVLLACIILTILFAPAATQQRNFLEILASTLYFENWFLSFQAVDYLNAEDPATPVQHFWAMSIQGQFYVIWAIIGVLLTLVIARSGRKAWNEAGLRRVRTVFVGIVALIFLASFTYSIIATSNEQAAAYFSLWTRLWEFAVGAMIALAGSKIVLRGSVAALTSWLGLIALVACGIVLDVGAQFPGYAALWPVLAAALLLVSSSNEQRWWAGTRVLSLRPLVWLGSISYGIYLWHWPLLIGYRYVRGELAVPGVVGGVAIVGGAVVLATLTHWIVERPAARTGRSQSSRIRVRSLLAISAAWVLVLGLGSFQTVRVQQEIAAAEQAAAEFQEGSGECFGFAALSANADCETVFAEQAIVPNRVALLEDTNGAYQCYTSRDAEQITRCSLGEPSSATMKVAIIGNSHAAMFVPIFDKRLEELGWTLDPYVGNGCIYGISTGEFGCEARLAEMRQAILEGGYDLVIFAGGRSGGEDASAEELQATRIAWSEVLESGAQLVTIEDNPRLTEAQASCVTDATEQELRDGACDANRDESLVILDRFAAMSEEFGTPMVETQEWYCVDDTCPVVIGNVIVYRDQHHITATYGESAGDELLASLLELIEAA
ncbi:acyltransferase family protein [Humidisolicoccus flavus]|uniref:acyltransferase family protein n=1 Tax=Humidisolicoccus flavus TaxID=3111414 RepID=UPI0032473BDC